MPDYVYALHDFFPEHEDEISFKAGERIEVVERDDMYGDGWWQGRNLAGKQGLFPKAYITANFDPPSASQSQSSLARQPTTLQSLPEEDGESEVNGSKSRGEDGEMMRATLTDVQKAIEQLGRRGGDNTDAQSFSFASMRTGEDMTDNETEDGEGEDWHKGARERLAENARRVQEERDRKQQEEDEALGVTARTAPPIEVEMSDESDGEDDDPRSRLMEEDEDELEAEHPPLTPGLAGLQDRFQQDATPSQELVVPPLGNGALLTATRVNFPTSSAPEPASLQTPTPAAAPPKSPAQQIFERENRQSGGSLPTPVSPASILTNAETDDGPASPISAMDNNSIIGSSAGPVPGVVYSPSPQRATFGSASGATLLAQSAAYASQSQSQAQTPVAQVAPVTLPSPAPSSAAGSALAAVAKPAEMNGAQSLKTTTHPSEWTVDEVIDWLKAKGFDQGVCDKFIEQEITGDVLLDLDVNLLKTEIGIAAFGKRMRIANAITELRRPPSINYSDHQVIAHAHTQSQSSQSHSQFYSGPNSAHLSMNSSQGQGQIVNAPMNGFMPSITSPESPPVTGDLVGANGTLYRRGRRDSDPGSILGGATMTDAEAAKAMVGLGIVADESALNAGSGKLKGRPAQLALSPSDTSLKKSNIINEVIDERAAMSESEVGVATPLSGNQKSRRRFLGRSNESASSHDTSRDGSTTLNSTAQPNSPASAKRSDDGTGSKHTRGKRSMDGKSSEQRLSIFGGSFTGTLGKSRKPAPRYSNSYASDDQSVDRKDRSLSRLYHMGSSSKKNSPRETNSGNDHKISGPIGINGHDGPSGPPARDPALLRKRTSSSNNVEPRAAITTLKPGQSILEQIGTPDHNGWMRKKGDRYNTWKLRYFVLKGPHLYILRSNAKTETKIKGYINIQGYKVIADEDIAPGKYGFRIVHDTDPPHFFSSDEQFVVREWMKAFMKATIGRDYSKPVISSCNIPTIPLTVAQTMNPAPRPPSPSQRAATQKAMRRENPNQLSSRDARVLMGLPSPDQMGDANNSRQRLDSFFSQSSVTPSAEMRRQEEQQLSPAIGSAPAPYRPDRDSRRSVARQDSMASSSATITVDEGLINWANSHLPKHLQVTEPNGPLYDGLALLRLGESIKGRPCEPPVPDSAFPRGPSDDKLDGLFRLFDFLLDNDVKMGTVSINDVRSGNQAKTVQLLKALKAWEDKRREIARSIGKSSVGAGPWMAVDSRY